MRAEETQVCDSRWAIPDGHAAQFRDSLVEFRRCRHALSRVHPPLRIDLTCDRTRPPRPLPVSPLPGNSDVIAYRARSPESAICARGLRGLPLRRARRRPPLAFLVPGQDAPPCWLCTVRNSSGRWPDRWSDPTASNCQNECAGPRSFARTRQGCQFSKRNRVGWQASPHRSDGARPGGRPSSGSARARSASLQAGYPRAMAKTRGRISLAREWRTRSVAPCSRGLPSRWSRACTGSEPPAGTGVGRIERDNDLLGGEIGQENAGCIAVGVQRSNGAGGRGLGIRFPCLW